MKAVSFFDGELGFIFLILLYKEMSYTIQL